MLLVGHGVAHAGSRRLGTRRFSIVHVATVLAGIAMLPFGISLGSATSATDAPISWTLRILTQSIAVPFLALSVTGPLLQWWFSHTRHHSARDPCIFLYAAGNLGSLIALVLYRGTGRAHSANGNTNSRVDGDVPRFCRPDNLLRGDHMGPWRRRRARDSCRGPRRRTRTHIRGGEGCIGLRSLSSRRA